METVRAMALSGSVSCSIIASSRTSAVASSSTRARTSISSASFFLRAPNAARSHARRIGLNVVAQAQSEDTESVGPVGVGAIAGGLVAVPVVAWSLYTLKTTGCGLPPGPGGAIGALEGVSYLAILGVIGWSIYTKVKTGAGLPNGPFGLLGAVEGLSYLAFLAILVVFGLQALDYGFIPGPLPGEQCFG
ncbi:hypothetical protein MPTK1_2g25140 [Marchantia polymorpha subsp. ruderalis]|nr:hypothetical protein MARPO_0168s0019 [Marchantia polymorpha]BBN03647.1 hypothetical protein Mp_2g25140 [Marchantia polymorpha subsp. ruderalis]|eukprot:PTQ28295.1 hypothetical protein MARPO_0168s0019 [Marchantia polymorpha]